MTVQEKIINQLGGKDFILKTGCKEIYPIFDDTLQIDLIKNRSTANRLMIRFFQVKNFYSMRFLRITGGRLNKKTWEFPPQKINLIAEYEDLKLEQVSEIFKEVTGFEI